MDFFPCTNESESKSFHDVSFHWETEFIHKMNQHKCGWHCFIIYFEIPAVYPIKLYNESKNEPSKLRSYFKKVRKNSVKAANEST